MAKIRIKITTMTTTKQQEIREAWIGENRHYGAQGLTLNEIADWWLPKIAQAREEGFDEHMKSCNVMVERIDELVAEKCQEALTTQQQQIEGRVKEYIEDYFKGLILIPNPQATKERLLLLLPEIISGNVKK